MIYHLQNDSELPDNPQKMMDVYNFSLVGEASDPVWEFGNFRQTLFYQQNEKFYRVKIAVKIADWEKFQCTRTCVYTHIRK